MWPDDLVAVILSPGPFAVDIKLSSDTTSGIRQIVSLLGLGATQGLVERTSWCIWLGYGGVTWKPRSGPQPLPLWFCAPHRPPGCHELRIFTLPYPSAIFLPWSQLAQKEEGKD